MTRWTLITDVQFGHADPDEETNSRRARYMIEKIASEDPDFVINAGDSINGAVVDGERRKVKKLWAQYQDAIRPLDNVCPLITVIGNHDQTGEAATSEDFCRETGRIGKQPYFSKTIGGVNVVVLHTMPGRHGGGFPDGTPQVRWLRSHLQRPRQAKCTIVCGHYPVFVNPWLYHTSDPSLHYDENTNEQGVLLPILLDAEVDMYLCGHHHVYERSRYKSLTQIMGGALGIAYEEQLEKPPHRYSKALDERQCYVRFTLDKNAISGESVDLDGNVIDTWIQTLNRSKSK